MEEVETVSLSPKKTENEILLSGDSGSVKRDVVVAPTTEPPPTKKTKRGESMMKFVSSDVSNIYADEITLMQKRDPNFFKHGLLTKTEMCTLFTKYLENKSLFVVDDLPRFVVNDELISAYSSSLINKVLETPNRQSKIFFYSRINSFSFFRDI